MSDDGFTKDNLDYYLRELGKVFRRMNGKKIPAEITLIGGAAILANYGFREMTYDMDAIIQASSAMKDAINQVGDTFSLPFSWLNTDFEKTKSYSPKLLGVSVYYKTFSNVLTVRTISAEYLIAMKLMSGRKYKNDLSDVIGILQEHANRQTPISLEQIQTAVITLYSAWDKLPAHSQEFAQQLCKANEYRAFYEQYRAQEVSAGKRLREFDKQYPYVLKEDNIDEILQQTKKRQRENER